MFANDQFFSNVLKFIIYNSKFNTNLNLNLFNKIYEFKLEDLFDVFKNNTIIDILN